MFFINPLLQITTGQSELGIESPETVAATTDITLIDLVMKGGLIMIPIFILSFIAIYIIAERIIAIRKAGKNANSLLSSITPAIKTGDVNTARIILNKENSSLATVLSKGVAKIGSPIKQIENAMEATGKLEIMKLEKGLAILGIVAAIAPMLGFVGTISGVIKIFYNISLADNISIGLIAGGLYEKMVTSAAGLIVGILAHTGYHYINMMIENLILKLESASLEFTELLSE